MPEPGLIPLFGRRDFLRRSLAVASAGSLSLGGNAWGMLAQADVEKMASDFLRAQVRFSCGLRKTATTTNPAKCRRTDPQSQERRWFRSRRWRSI